MRRLCTVCLIVRRCQHANVVERPGPFVCRYCRPPKARDHGERDPEYARNWKLLDRYGITSEDYDRMLAEQMGLCRICRRPPKTVRLHVDHDHDTGEIRGLLCPTCNQNIEWLIAHRASALAYLTLNYLESQ